MLTIDFTALLCHIGPGWLRNRFEEMLVGRDGSDVHDLQPVSRGDCAGGDHGAILLDGALHEVAILLVLPAAVIHLSRAYDPVHHGVAGPPSRAQPCRLGVYFINGDPTVVADLERAGIREAQAALVFPAAPTDEADMHSILTIMAIESVAPEVRTVAAMRSRVAINSSSPCPGVST